ncbi:MAG: hypothetical protein ABI425_02015 [Patescibacteria group bacterium]
MERETAGLGVILTGIGYLTSGVGWAITAYRTSKTQNTEPPVVSSKELARLELGIGVELIAIGTIRLLLAK